MTLVCTKASCCSPLRGDPVYGVVSRSVPQVYPGDMPVRRFAELTLSEVSNIEDGPTRAEVELALRLARQTVLQSEVRPGRPGRGQWVAGVRIA